MLVTETLEDEWYVEIKTYKFTIFEDLFVSLYIVFLHYPYLQSLPTP